MKIFHQCGHNFIWNIQSFKEDQVGDGFILSPVNVESSEITKKFSPTMLSSSWIDPQMYLPEDSKKFLASYSFFPSNVIDEFSTTEFEQQALDIAFQCLEFQSTLNLSYYVIPTRHYQDLPDDYYSQMESLFVAPFIEAKNKLGFEKPLMLTLIVKPNQLEFGPLRDRVLSWASSFSEITCIYLIVEKNSSSKQIKDPSFLCGTMRFIKALRDSGMEVHLGYTGNEGLIYSVADPSSVPLGSYENLRSFKITRMKTLEKKGIHSPRARIYSGKLLQWIVDTSLPAIRELVEDWSKYFDQSEYSDYLFDPDKKLNFQRKELHKHYFFVYSNQIKELPAVTDRPEFLRKKITESIQMFEEISSAGVLLDSDSDGSHLVPWFNAINMFERNPG